jgi:4-amino-4-deoxy-L-arabinose transferase-like glycosyltransferase
MTAGKNTAVICESQKAVSEPTQSARQILSWSIWSPWAMVIAALLIRFVVMGFTYQLQLDPAQDHQAFGWETGKVARSIASGQGFSSPYREPTGPTALIPPVYTYLVAGVFKVFGIYTAISALVLLSLNNLFSSLTCLPVYFLARRVFGPRVGAWSGWVWALFPYSIALSNTVIWETSLTTLLFPFLLLLTLYLEHSKSVAAWLGYGLLWGFAGLTSPVCLSVLPFLGGWIWIRHWRRGSNCTGPAAMASLVFLLMVTPWIWRCSHIYGRFVAFRGNFGMEVLVGNSDDNSSPANWGVLPGNNPAELEKLKHVGEAAYMADKQLEANRLIRRHPMRFVALTLRRILNTWTGLWNIPNWGLDGTGLPNIITYSAISLLAFWGLGLAISNDCDGVIPFAMVLLFFPSVYYLTHSDMGFRHPVDTVMVILGVYGVCSLRRKNPNLSRNGATNPAQ